MKSVLPYSASLLALALACGGTTKPTTEPTGPTEATPTETTPTETAPTETTPAQPEQNPMANEPKYRWDLTALYPSDDAWNQAAAATEARFASITKCKGKLGKSAKQLADCLANLFDVQNEVGRIYSYASKRSDENTSDAAALEMLQRAQGLFTRLGQTAAFVSPEVLAMGKAKVEKFIKREPKLADYDFFLRDIIRLKPHTLDSEGESILAATHMMSGAPATVYGILKNSDIPWPTITLSDGTQAFLDSAGYTRYRGVANRADRKAVFDAFFGEFKQFEQTFGMTLNADLKKDVFYAQTRHYPDTLSAASDGQDIPEAVYKTLVKAANDNLPTAYRYFKLRGRMMGIEDLAYYDLYPPMVTTDLEFPYDQAVDLVEKAVAPLGEEYVATVKKGFADRWIDVFPRKGKRPGAYSSGSVYGVHPYMLLNYNPDYEGVSTLAHEFGHSMHSFLSSSSQPYAKADYATFVAEVASTFNEALLLDYMLKHAKSDDEKLYYLGSALENLRLTFFRQTMFAEFELKIHELVEKHEELTGARFTKIYRDLVRRYQGSDQGVVAVPDAYDLEWAYIPHFVDYNYYVYKYATSIAASSLFAKEVLEGKPGARDRYLSVLEAGGSDFPYQMLKDAGVDLATPAPYEALVAQMNSIMDQMEAILDKQGK